MIALGLIVVAVCVAGLTAAYFRAPRSRPFPRSGLLGLGVIAAAEILLFLDVQVVATYFTPLVWSGYILTVDAAVFAIRGRSLMRTTPNEFVWMATLSILLWVVFEIYNLRLANWHYGGMPLDLSRYFGFGWAFATIWPAILETTEFLLATVFREPAVPAAPEAPPGDRRHTAPTMLIGLLCVTFPVLVPRLDFGEYLFGLVWIGFILTLDPLNYRAGHPSLWGDRRRGCRSRVHALLLGGLVCGVLWEFWNYWAGAKWYYIFRITESVRVFEMPIAGYLGFPVFALEVFAMYVFVAKRLNLPFVEVR